MNTALRQFKKLQSLLDVDWANVSDGQYLKRNGSLIDGGTPSGGGGSSSRVLLGSATASASSQINVDNVVDGASYSMYEVEFEDVVSASDGAGLEVMARSSVPANISGTFEGQWMYSLLNGAGDGRGDLISSTGFQVAANVGNDTDEFCHGMLKVYPSPSFDFVAGQFFAVHVVNNGNQVVSSGPLGATFSTALDGFGLAFDSGNITSGTLRVYGITKT